MESAHNFCSFSNTICLGSMERWCTMILRLFLAGIAQFHEIVSVNDFWFLVGSKNFIGLFWVSWEELVLHGYDCNHRVAKSCTTTAYRWLFRDSLSSLRTLWSAVIKSPKCSALGPTVPVRLLQEVLVIFVFKQISQFGSFGKWAYTLCLREPGSTVARGSIGSSWDDLKVSWLCCSEFHQGSVEVLSSTKFSLNSCSQSWLVR